MWMGDKGLKCFWYTFSKILLFSKDQNFQKRRFLYYRSYVSWWSNTLRFESEFAISRIQSNLCTIIPLWPKICGRCYTVGRCSVVDLCYKDSNWDSKKRVVVDRWSLLRFDCAYIETVLFSTPCVIFCYTSPLVTNRWKNVSVSNLNYAKHVRWNYVWIHFVRFILRAKERS
jgi:hypothetical protein